MLKKIGVTSIHEGLSNVVVLVSINIELVKSIRMVMEFIRVMSRYYYIYSFTIQPSLVIY